MIERYRYATKGVLAAAGTAMMLALGAPGAEAADRPDIAVAVNKLPRSLDPGTETGNVDVRVYYSIFDTLIRRDFANPEADGGARLIPGLATSWSRLSPDTLELKLRQGVTCHDGNPFDADDVMATFSPERLWGEAPYYPKGREYFAHLKSVEKIDPFTVRFTTNGPDVSLEHLLSGYTAFIVCDEALNAFKKDGVDYKVWMEEAANAMKWNPVGTGPYKVDSYQKNDHLKLAAFDAYWDGAPAAASINFREVPEAAARISGLVSGEFDIAIELTPDQWDVLDRYSDIVAKSVVIENTHIVAFNAKDPLLSDKKLRQALSLAIDRNALIDALWRGKTFTPNGHQLPIFGPMYVKDNPGYEYDPEKAKKLLSESSYKGETITYRLIPNYYIYNVEAAQIIQEMWRAIGVNVEIEYVESFKAVRDKGLQVYAWSNTYRVPDPSGSLLALWGPEAAVQTKYHFFEPPAEFNELSGEILKTADMTKRRAMFARMLEIFQDEMPMTMLYNPLTTYAMRKNIEWEPYSQFYMDFRPSNFSIKSGS
ncbi:MAG: ABC transporter substrate-binding protein [Kiloniellaceae bacterium]